MVSDPSPTLPLQLTIQIKVNLGSYIASYSIISSKFITIPNVRYKFITFPEESTGEKTILPWVRQIILRKDNNKHET